MAGEKSTKDQLFDVMADVCDMISHATVAELLSLKSIDNGRLQFLLAQR